MIITELLAKTHLNTSVTPAVCDIFAVILLSILCVDTLSVFEIRPKLYYSTKLHITCSSYAETALRIFQHRILCVSLRLYFSAGFLSCLRCMIHLMIALAMQRRQVRQPRIHRTYFMITQKMFHCIGEGCESLARASVLRVCHFILHDICCDVLYYINVKYL